MLKFFTSDLRRNIIKIICLAVGIALGTILWAKAFFEQTYDNFHIDKERLYIVNGVILANGISRDTPSTPSGIAHGLKRYLHQVEEATHYSLVAHKKSVRTDDDRTFWTDAVILADSCFFDVLQREIISGNPHEVLSVKNQCFIPQSLANIIGGDVIGTALYLPENASTFPMTARGDYRMTIGGVYKDFPKNSLLPNAIYLSLNSAPQFFIYNPDNYSGSDRFVSILKLYPDVDLESLRPGIRKMIEENVDEQFLQLFKYDLKLYPLAGTYSSDANVLLLSFMLSLLGLIIIACAGVNYLLITLGQLNARTKEMAIRKCYGTSNLKIFLRVVAESLFFILISGVLGLLIIFTLTPACMTLLTQSPEELLSNGNVWAIELLIFILILIMTGIIPAWIYCRIPVVNAFRTKINHRRLWKKGTLAIQFFAVGLLCCLLVTIIRQLYYITDMDLGFSYENLAIVPIRDCSPEESNRIATELGRLSCVEATAASEYAFNSGAGGSSVYRNGIAEDPYLSLIMGKVTPDYFDVMGIEFVQGNTFHENADSSSTQIIVEESFIDIVRNHFGYDGTDIVGQSFKIAGCGDGEHTICGVVGNTEKHGFMKTNFDNTGTIYFPGNDNLNLLYVKFSQLTDRNLSEAQSVIDRIITNRNIYITPMYNNIEPMTKNIKLFGLAVLIVSTVTILIVLTGLIGYVSDEVARRSKEVAIRKINGSDERGIVALFCKDILTIALMALTAGIAVACVVGNIWLSNFTVQVGISIPGLFSLLICILALIMGVIVINSLTVARNNPTKYLRAS